MSEQLPAWVIEAAYSVYRGEKEPGKTEMERIATVIAKHAAPVVAENKRLRESLDRIAQGKDAPDLYAGQMRTGLRCGVEDRDIICRYESAEYGWDDAAERFLEWANNEARAALEHSERTGARTMSGTVKVGDVIALPVGIEPREGDPNFVRLYDASNFGVCPRIAKMFAVVVKNAINDHDRLQAENDRMRAALEKIVSTSIFCIGPGCYYCKSDIDHPPTVEATIAKKTLQACDAQQENANG